MKYSKFSKSKKPKIFLTILVLSIALAGVVVFKSNLFVLKDVQINGVSQLKIPYISNAITGQYAKTNFLLTSKDKVRLGLSKTLPEYEIEEVSYVFPGKLEVTLKERLVTYVISAPNGFFSVDNNGFVSKGLDKGQKYSRNYLEYDKDLTPGETINDAVLLTAFLYAQLDLDVNVTQSRIQLDLPSGGNVILPADTDYQKAREIASVLQKVLQKYTIEGKSIELIDLRFSKPIVKYN